MPARQLTVRSEKARDLAHALSRRERRPIRAIVEDALAEYARRQSAETAPAFLRRMRAVGAADDDAISRVEAAVEEHRGRDPWS